MNRSIILCFAVLAGCSSSTTKTPVPAVPEGQQSSSQNGTTEQPRVALIMKSLANEFFSTMAAGAENHQRENAETYQLLINGIKDESDLARQVALVEEMVAVGVDAGQSHAHAGA